MGKISSAITSTPHVTTPIQKKLSRLGKWLVFIAILLCSLVIVIGIAYNHDPVEQVKIGLR